MEHFLLLSTVLAVITLFSIFMANPSIEQAELDIPNTDSLNDSQSTELKYVRSTTILHTQKDGNVAQANKNAERAPSPNMSTEPPSSSSRGTVSRRVNLGVL